MSTQRLTPAELDALVLVGIAVSADGQVDRQQITDLQRRLLAEAEDRIIAGQLQLRVLTTLRDGLRDRLAGMDRGGDGV